MPRRARTVVPTLAALSFFVLLVGCSSPGDGAIVRTLDPLPGERHFGPLRMLTDGGENAEAYFSFDGRQLVFQSTRPPYGCDQIFTMRLDGSRLRRVSSGLGRTTCAYFMPGDKQVLYSSTHLGGDPCPTPPDMTRGYTWGIFPEYDVFVADADGQNVRRLTDTPGYDAEATVSPRGDRIVFTSVRGGDLDIYSMNIDGSDVRRLTDAVGYDGGPFYSPDGSMIVYRAHHPADDAQLADYKALFSLNLIRPANLEIWTMKADGSDKRQLTKLGVASFAPFFHPGGRKIIFSSNYPNARSREFDLYLIDLDGGNMEKVTQGPGFDGFPMFAPDGHTFVFCSNRSNSKPGETNVFLTTWRD